MDYGNICMGCMEDKGEAEVCPYCGWEEDKNLQVTDQLPPGTILNNRYLLGKVLRHEGFYITYLAIDTILRAKLVIKEFFPHGFIARNQDRTTIAALSSELKKGYELELNKFLEEARMIYQFKELPGIVPIIDFFDQNGTAYIVMMNIDGITLKEHLKEKGGRVSYDDAVRLVSPIMKSLKEIHKAGMIHRNINPDNIYITDNGAIKLLEFGSSSYSSNVVNTNMPVMLKCGYAPLEQYYKNGKQGQWTDVYSVAATIYNMITGRIPPEASERIRSDTIKLPSNIGIDISKDKEKVIMRALSVIPGDRYQSIEEFNEALLSASKVDEYDDGAGREIVELVEEHLDEIVAIREDTAKVKDDTITVEDSPKLLNADRLKEENVIVDLWEDERIDRKNTILRKKLIFGLELTVVVLLLTITTMLIKYRVSNSNTQNISMQSNNKVVTTPGPNKNDGGDAPQSSNKPASTQKNNSNKTNSPSPSVKTNPSTPGDNVVKPNPTPASVVTPGPILVQTPKPTPYITPRPTQKPTPNATVVPTPETTTEPTPEPILIPTPEPTPEVTPDPILVPTPEPTTEPTPESIPVLPMS